MKAITWAPKTNKELDKLFDALREERYQDRSHRLWKNYSKETFFDSGVVALTISFDENNDPEMCGSISNRSCWPKDAYRIGNRLFKARNKLQMLREVTPAGGEFLLSQLSWLKENTDYQLAFASRQTDNDWPLWMIRHFKRQYNLEFKTNNNKYLTCPNECDDTCWQRIIYQGNEEILQKWRHRQ